MERISQAGHIKSEPGSSTPHHRDDTNYLTVSVPPGHVRAALRIFGGWAALSVCLCELIDMRNFYRTVLVSVEGRD